MHINFKIYKLLFVSVQANLLTHMKTHTDNKEFECKKCNLKYKFVQSLNNHMKLKHSNLENLELFVN